MNRRLFIRNTGIAGGILGVSPAFSVELPKTEQFKLDFAPHFGMFSNGGGKELEGQLQFMSDQGFMAMEDNGMKGRSVEEQEMIAAKMSKLGMKMGVFVAHTIYWNEASLTSGDKDKQEQFLKEIAESVDVAKRVNAKWMTVVPGYLNLRRDMGYQMVTVAEVLKKASAILEPHGIVMVLEPLNPRDHPGLFLTKISQAYELCKLVGSPSCKILFDLYHQQITEGNLIPNIDSAFEEIGYFQIGDNPGRKEPTTGEVNFKNVFAHIHKKGYSGIYGMEHGNSQPGKEGEMALIKAYRSVDYSG